jgi:C1A family cysteine protease
MFTPIDHAYRGKGYKFLRVDRTQMPSGGGHAYLVRGCNLNMRTPGGGKGAYLIQNSWGPWGADGTAWIAIDDMAALMREDGEAATPTEVRMGGPEKDRLEDVVE